jgi:hypothetical protein
MAGVLAAAAAEQDADQQADTGGDGDGLVGVGADGLVRVFGAGDDAFARAIVELAEAFLGGVIAGAEGAHGVVGVLGDGGSHHVFGFGHEGLKFGEQFLGRLGRCLAVVFHWEIFVWVEIKRALRLSGFAAG